MNIKFGVSTASLYPMHTEEAIEVLSKSGVKNIEIFYNAMSELTGTVGEKISHIVRENHLNITSIHPFQSGYETFSLFGSYDRRMHEFIDDYKKYFEYMEKNKIGIFVLHGAKYENVSCSYERYLERYHLLSKIARQYGVIVAQENVSYCKCGRLDFAKRLLDDLGDEVSFVLDLKQSVRVGSNPFEFLETLGKRIVHIHASDHIKGDGGKTCMKIGDGDFDFKAFFKKLNELNYNGRVIVELYRENYSDVTELADSMIKLQEIYEKL